MGEKALFRLLIIMFEVTGYTFWPDMRYMDFKKDAIDKYNNGFKGKMFTQVNYLTGDFVKKYMQIEMLIDA